MLCILKGPLNYLTYFHIGSKKCLVDCSPGICDESIGECLCPNNRAYNIDDGCGDEGSEGMF